MRCWYRELGSWKTIAEGARDRSKDSQRLKKISIDFFFVFFFSEKRKAYLFLFQIWSIDKTLPIWLPTHRHLEMTLRHHQHVSCHTSIIFVGLLVCQLRHLSTLSACQLCHLSAYHSVSFVICQLCRRVSFSFTFSFFFFADRLTITHVSSEWIFRQGSSYFGDFCQLMSFFEKPSMSN